MKENQDVLTFIPRINTYIRGNIIKKVNLTQIKDKNDIIVFKLPKESADTLYEVKLLNHDFYSQEEKSQKCVFSSSFIKQRSKESIKQCREENKLSSHDHIDNHLDIKLVRNQYHSIRIPQLLHEFLVNDIEFIKKNKVYELPQVTCPTVSTMLDEYKTISKLGSPGEIEFILLFIKKCFNQSIKKKLIMHSSQEITQWSTLKSLSKIKCPDTVYTLPYLVRFCYKFPSIYSTLSIVPDSKTLLFLIIEDIMLWIESEHLHDFIPS
mmetsp:Transcript_141/g.242  ORF Transcript_141/g.242 Transcript_141/m.242 type:complete len:266 (-) Transcript_141:661-1458(-)